jgi:dUTP pyrophosphatase
MKLKVLHNSGIINRPSHEGDAGFDIVADQEPKIHGHLNHHLFYQSIHYLEYDTKLKIQPEKKYGKEYTFYLLLYPRSSIIKTNLILANSVGVIDSGFNGNIKVCFKYISQPEDMKIVTGKTFKGNDSNGVLVSINPQRIYHKGDKIAQLIPAPHYSMELEEVDSMIRTKRGLGGFGSTDNK